MRVELPSGTVTFLFTDIEGSTRLLEKHGERYTELLAAHRRVLREAFARYGGVEVDTQGDAFFVAFSRAADALAAADVAQRELELPVRMGIHTGEPQLTAEGYAGMDVHRAARICAAGHGRQVLVSQTTRDLVGADLRDLGEHRLKDLGRPVRLFQLGDEDFPPARTLNRTNLPAQPSPLVGRDRELTCLQQLVREARVVTLIGPGGSGKTRLALQAAAELVDEFPDGVFWVPLAAVFDPDLVLPSIAQAAGLRGDPAAEIGGREMLLVLDNFEQVIEAAPRLPALLEPCPRLRLLVTSREVLRIAGERDYAVDPLAEPDAVELFRERAVNAEPIEAVREICARLDGLPLAIELAAARTRLLPPDRLLERLDHVLPLLTGGRRDAPERQRTLRSTIEWSHALLDKREQRGFRRLAVFPGGFTVEAAEEVCEVEIDTLGSLVEKSLVRRWASGRLGMLETIRELAEEKLADSGEALDLHRKNAEYFAELSRSANLQVESIGKAPQRHELVIPEQANLRATIDWAADADPELALTIAVALENFWATNNPQEGIRRLDHLLHRAAAAPPRLRAQALRALGGSTQLTGDVDGARSLYEKALELFADLGDDAGAATLRFRIATTIAHSDPEKCRLLLERSVAEFDELDYDAGRCQALGTLGNVHLRLGNRERAEELLEEASKLARKIGFIWWAAGVQETLAESALRAGDLERAETAAREALELHQRIGDRVNMIYDLAHLAECAAGRGRLARAGAMRGIVQAEEERRPPHPAWLEVKARLDGTLGPLAGPDYDAAVSRGHALPADDAMDYALSDID